MDNSELKSNALDALNASRAAFDGGNLKEAKDQAEKAWNCYYELQKQRNKDEDFTDLIYSARNMYEKAQAALDEQAADEAPEEEEDDPIQSLNEIRRLELSGFAGNTVNGVKAASWYIHPKNWTVLEEIGINFAQRATDLLNGAINNVNAPLPIRIVAANEAAKMCMVPMYGNVNIENARRLSQWAVTEGAAAEDLDLETLVEVYRTAVKAALLTGNEEAARKYATDAVNRGADLGVWQEICSYAYRHDQESARAIEDRMYADGCWQGMILHAITLIDEWIDDQNNDEKYQAVKDYALNSLAIYSDEHWGEEGGFACLSLAVYMTFLQNWEGFIDQDLMEIIKAAADAFSPYALFYLGEIYNDTAIQYEAVDPADSRIEPLRNQALNYYSQAAALGHRGGINEYLNLLKAGYGNPEDIEKYTTYAKQLDVDLS